LCYFGSEDGVHHHLECGWGVCEAKEHNGWFKQSFQGKEGSFPFISFLDVDVIIPPSDINFCEEGASAQSVNNLRD